MNFPYPRISDHNRKNPWPIDPSHRVVFEQAHIQPQFLSHMAEGVVVVLHRWVALELVEQENRESSAKGILHLHKWVQCYHHMQIDVQTLKHHMRVKRWISFSFHLLYGPPFAFKKTLRIIHTFLESIRMDCLHRTDFQLLFADFAYSEMLKEWRVCLTGGNGWFECWKQTLVGPLWVANCEIGMLGILGMMNMIHIS